MCTFLKYLVILDYEIILIDETLYYSCLLFCANEEPQPLFSSNPTLHAYHQQLFTGISHHYIYQPFLLQAAMQAAISSGHTTGSPWYQPHLASFLATTFHLSGTLHLLDSFCSYLFLCLECFHLLFSPRLILHLDNTNSTFISQLNHWPLIVS